MKNLYITEDIGKKGTRWLLCYKDPINGECIEVSEKDALEIIIAKEKYGVDLSE